MKSIAIVRATDILKLRSTLLEMNRAGIKFDGQPKEINPASVEKALSQPSDRNYEFCSLVPIMQENEISNKILKTLTLYSEVLLFDESSELFNRFSRLIQVLPDLDLPNMPTNENKKPITNEKTSGVYLGVFVNKRVQVHTISGNKHIGILRHADSIGVFFEPDDGSSPVFFTWPDVKKIVIPREEKS
ncbi:MAG: hypothetical protein D4R88_02245 [Methanosarcinales archaeon]|nr:MAG: hypothetical protein D4R88_02245 [Methanosarcinales archaeon]